MLGHSGEDSGGWYFAHQSFLQSSHMNVCFYFALQRMALESGELTFPSIHELLVGQARALPPVRRRSSNVLYASLPSAVFRLAERERAILHWSATHLFDNARERPFPGARLFVLERVRVCH